MKIKVIDLLKLVCEKKAPEKIIWEDKVWEYEQSQYLCKDYDIDSDDYGANIWNGYNFNILNDEVEILDTPKGIEKLTHLSNYQSTDMYAHKDKINELVDKINELIEVVNNLDK